LDPKFLAQLIETNYAQDLERVYTLFGIDIVTEAILTLYFTEVFKLPPSCLEYKGRKTGFVGRVSSRLATEKEYEQGNTYWKLKAFIKLCSSLNHRPKIKN
jgi:hypothetical protein